MLSYLLKSVVSIVLLHVTIPIEKCSFLYTYTRYHTKVLTKSILSIVPLYVTLPTKSILYMFSYLLKSILSMVFQHVTLPIEKMLFPLHSYNCVITPKKCSFHWTPVLVFFIPEGKMFFQ